MGVKLDHYIDTEGNTIRDDDTVIFDGKEYRTAYISHEYVNLDAGRPYGWLHLPFKCGVPIRKVKNAPQTAYPEQGTLQEIGAQVGDVVRYERFEPKGLNRTIARMDTPYWIDSVGQEMAQDSPYWRIISRASDKPASPVRTVTTTRQEVVPGVYGKVKVTTPKSSLPGVAGIDLTCDGWWTATELRAAAKTLTEIADALDEG